MRDKPPPHAPDPVPASARSGQTLKILLLEDQPTDAELITRELREAGLDFVATRVATREAFVAALESFAPDIVLSDYKLPGFDADKALAHVRRIHPEIPVVIVTGTPGEEAAIEMLKAGAKDYVRKGNLLRLPSAVERAITVEQGIRARKAAEQATRDSEAKFRAFTAAAPNAIIVIDGSSTISYWNPMAEPMLGYTAAEAVGRKIHDWLLPARFRAAAEAGFRAFAKTGQGPALGKTTEVAARRKDGIEIPVELSLNALKVGAEWHAVGILHDITERKEAERTLLRLNRTLRTLSRGNEVLVHADSEAKLLSAMCHVIVETGGYRMVWVGVPEQDAAKSVTSVAWAGEAGKYLDSAQVTWADEPRGRGLVGRAIRSGEPINCKDIAADPDMMPWQEAAKRHGFASAIALPLKDETGVFAALTLYGDEVGAFDVDELKLLQDLADGLAFGIRGLREHVAHEALNERWRTSLEATVAAIAATVEMRDPYTSGHQQRVARLAVAMARELGLRELQIQGLYLAGIIHDVGKINIPGEILNKPGKLSKLEYQMIQGHAEAGYDIVKGVDFPWPIADIVRQHHERLDGSGYPQGLRGEQILLEAKILTVADVVEAMMSHRPYRPTLGLDAAVAEIENGKGRIYDPAAVDACVALFRQNRFTFE